MASTSVSSIQRSFKYDVFLSFRGEDTRKNFVGHLYEALKQKGIETYKDDEKIEKGETIDNQLIESIDESRYCIIVFSKNYATSSWCLDELVKIMECRKTTEQTAYPVFYDVEPTEVRNQSGSVGEAFCKHEKNEAAVKWRKAMKEAAGLAGWELKTTANGDHSKLIQIVVADIFKKLSSINSSVDGKLVGMATRIEEVLESLEIGTEDVRLIGIKGMGGGGKTTLATILFNQISNHFEGTSFVDNVREKTPLSGLAKLQEQILTDVSGNITINSASRGKNTMKQMMHRKKALIVLDDVDNIDQLEALAGDPNWFKLGSRIIITTRDVQVLESHRVKFIHDINLLSHSEGICLLSRHAFERESPTTGYEELAKKVVDYASGLPLTIKSLGSSLYGKDKPYWKSTLERLKKIPLKTTMEILELSYNCLEDDYKEIFLDVACILKGWFKSEAIIALESCGFHAINGLTILEQKSLITVSKDGKLGMHDHLEEMGRNIVRLLHPNSRLWIGEEIKDILTNDMGTEATKCISLECEGPRNMKINPYILIKGLRNMKELRFLRVNNYAGKSYATHPYPRRPPSEGKRYHYLSRCVPNALDEVRLYLPNSLQYLQWYNYPFRSLSLNKVLCNLRFLEIYEATLFSTFDLRVAPNLEMLCLRDCYSLVELRMPTTSQNLRSIKLSHINKLRTLDLRLAPNLEKLCLINCYSLVELRMPTTSQNLRSIKLHGLVKLRILDLGRTPNLEKLTLFDCRHLTLDLRLAPNLEKLCLKSCHYLVELRMPTTSQNLRSIEIDVLEKFQILDLGRTPNIEKFMIPRDSSGLKHYLDQQQLEVLNRHIDSKTCA